MAQLHPAAAAHVDSSAAEAAQPEVHTRAGFWPLALGSIGVVYGDIGTSPLYAFRESVAAGARRQRRPEAWSSASSR